MTTNYRCGMETEKNRLLGTAESHINLARESDSASRFEQNVEVAKYYLGRAETFGADTRGYHEEIKGLKQL